MTHHKFPIRLDDTVRTVPWEMLEPHEAQAISNHGHSLDELAARGGLTPCEAIAILEDRPWERMAMTAATLRLKGLVDIWLAHIPPYDGPAPVIRSHRVERLQQAVQLLERLRDGHTAPNRSHYNRLITMIGDCL